MTDDPVRRAAMVKREMAETQGAFDTVRAAMVAQLLESPVLASQARESLYLAVKSLDAVRSVLTGIIDTGKMEEANEAIREQFTPAA